jgi:lysosomal alpha-mannosidase
LLNISECDVSENNSKFVITLYNPLSHAVTTPVRIPVKYADYKVTGPNGNDNIGLKPWRSCTITVLVGF